jgi:hypothetical protein
MPGRNAAKRSLSPLGHLTAQRHRVRTAQSPGNGLMRERRKGSRGRNDLRIGWFSAPLGAGAVSFGAGAKEEPRNHPGDNRFFYYERTIPILIESSIAWDYLERTGELGDATVAGRVLLHSIETMVVRGDLMLANIAIIEYQKYLAEREAA